MFEREEESSDSSVLTSSTSSFADLSLPSETDSGFYSNSSSGFFRRIRIPIEQNLQEVLQNVTGVEDLKNVTQVKLRLITRDVCLQYLYIYTPNLSELILNNSIVSSLRDLGNGLINLKILQVNRCGLSSLDGVFAFENLEELHAEDNFIEDITPCTSLSKIQMINLRRNALRFIKNIAFFSLCPTLKHLILEGNIEITSQESYRRTIKEYLPDLLSLDGTGFVNAPNDRQICLPPIQSKTMDSNLFTLLPLIPYNPLIRSRSAGGYRDKIPLSVTPSFLTSGSPICGNIAISLRNKYRNFKNLDENEKQHKSF